jgi:hypothetical protein
MPRVDKSYPAASVASTRLAVARAGYVRKDVAQVARDGPSVTDGNHRKFSQDTLNGDDIKKPKDLNPVSVAADDENRSNTLRTGAIP